MQHALDTLRPYWPLLMALVGYPLITAALNWWLWWDSPANWDAFVARQPRAAFAVRILRAVGPHLRKVVVAYRDWAAARGALPRPTLDAVASRADEVPLPRPEAPAPVSPLRAVTVSHQPPPPADEERGSIDVRSMLVVVVALAVALPLGVVVTGCPLVRDVAMRAAPGVPDPNDCTPGVQRCADGVPVVCSATAREWPALPRSADGAQRTCAPGACVVSDAGVAHCAPATDGGAL